MNKIKDNIPVYSVILLTLSLVRLQFYYSSFGIDIVSYIDVSEALLLSIPFFLYTIVSQIVPLVFVGVVFIIMGLIKFVKYVILKQNFKESPEELTPSIDYNNETFWQIAKRKWADIFTLTTCYIAAAISLSKSDLEFATVNVCAFVFFLLGSIGGKNILSLFNKRITLDPDTFYTIFFTIRLSLMCIAIAKCQAIYTKTSPNRDKVLVVFDNGNKVITSPNYRFVGKTKGFIFFYNKKMERGDSYPLGEVKTLKIIPSSFIGG